MASLFEFADLSLNEVDSPSAVGAQVLKAGASGDLEKIKEIRKRFGNDSDFKRICDVYGDVATGWRVLNHAASLGNFELCDFLIKQIGAYADISSYNGDTPMILAAKGKHVKIVEYLISHSARIEVSNNKGYTALHYAVLQDNMVLMELLLKNGSPTETDSVEGTPLQISASRGCVKAVKLLLQYGVEPNSMSLAVPSSPLIGAIKSRSFECMKCLLEAKADPDRFLYGLTPLAHAAEEGDTRFLKCLLAAGASADKPSTGSMKPIENAALAENLEGVKILFPLTPPIKEYDPSIWTVDGIMKYNRSARAKKKREEHKIRYLEVLEGLGKSAMESDDYNNAVEWYSEAAFLDPSNPKWPSIRSMCYARVGNGVHALKDAKESIRLKPQTCPCPRPHYEVKDQGDAWQLFKRYHTATTCFILAPQENRTRDLFRVALFEYFSWLYTTSCPAEMMLFFQHFM